MRPRLTARRRHARCSLRPYADARACGVRLNDAGFTLVEVMLVVAVLGILAAVVMPSLSSSRDRTALEAVARMTASDLRLARQAAIQYGTSYTVTINPSANAYTIAHTGSASPPPLANPLAPNAPLNLVDLDQSGAGRFGQSSVYLGGAALKISRASASDVTFGPTGGTGPARSQDTVLWLTDGRGNERRCVVLTIQWITGQVSVGDVQAFPSTQSQPSF